MIGETVSHYVILDKLGEGGMGQVYLAEDTRLERKVALKVLPTALADDPDRLRRLEREAKALAALDHPNIVGVFSIEEDQGVHFLTMAHIEGRTLDELIPSEGLAAERLLRLGVPLADALRAAHASGIVHRDLKPGNIMVDREDRLRILDFGLAKLEPQPASPDASTMVTQTMTALGAVLGSYPYMSPEQAEGKIADPRSDIFSLGVVLFEMATGRRPFRGDTAAALVSAILRDTPPLVTEVRTDLPDKLGRIIRRCLEKHPERRIQSALDVRRELQDLEREVASGTAVISTAGADAPRIGSLVVLPLRNLTGDPEQEYFVDGMTEALITGLSQIAALKVISRVSAMRYKGSSKPLAEIARELDVEAVVDGSVMRETDRIGITAALIDAATESNLWSDRYERELTSILALQGDVAQAIAREIRITLTPQEEDLLAAAHSVDPAAYEAALKARYYRDRFTPQDLETAEQYFRAALDRDPDYALALTGLGTIWNYQMVLGVARPLEAGPRVLEAHTRAIELDASLAEAHFGLAALKFSFEWDWEGAEKGFRRAIALNPNYAEARIHYSHFLTTQGRPDEGAAQVERALELDPLHPFFQAMYGVQLYLSGRHEDSIAQFRKTLEKTPGLAFAHIPFWRVLHYQGMYDEALAQARAHFEAVGEGEVVAALERGHVEGGYRRAMSLAAEALATGSHTALARPLNVLCLYDDAGQTEPALEWLERAYEIRDIDMAYLAVELFSDDLRNHPRFRDMLRRMNLPG